MVMVVCGSWKGGDVVLLLEGDEVVGVGFGFFKCKEKKQ